MPVPLGRDVGATHLAFGRRTVNRPADRGVSYLKGARGGRYRVPVLRRNRGNGRITTRAADARRRPRRAGRPSDRAPQPRPAPAVPVIVPASERVSVGEKPPRRRHCRRLPHEQRVAILAVGMGGAGEGGGCRARTSRRGPPPSPSFFRTRGSPGCDLGSRYAHAAPRSAERELRPCRAGLAAPPRSPTRQQVPRKCRAPRRPRRSLAPSRVLASSRQREAVPRMDHESRAAHERRRRRERREAPWRARGRSRLARRARSSKVCGAGAAGIPASIPAWAVVLSLASACGAGLVRHPTRRPGRRSSNPIEAIADRVEGAHPAWIERR